MYLTFRSGMSFKHGWIQGLRLTLSVSLVSSILLSTSPHVSVLSFSALPLLCTLDNDCHLYIIPMGNRTLSLNTQRSLPGRHHCPCCSPAHHWGGRSSLSFTRHPGSGTWPSTEEAGHFKSASGGPTAWGRRPPKNQAQQPNLTLATALRSLGWCSLSLFFLHLLILLAITNYLFDSITWAHNFHSLNRYWPNAQRVPNTVLGVLSGSFPHNCPAGWELLSPQRHSWRKWDSQTPCDTRLG